MPTGPAAYDVASRRFASQLLSGPPARTAIEVAGRLLAIQAQDARGARLAIRARSTGLTVPDVDAALTADRSLVITWLNRCTLHLIRSEDYWLLHRLTVRPQHEAGCMRNLAAAGVTADAADKAVDVITAALAAAGPLTRLQIRDRLAAAGHAGNATLHLLMLSCQRGAVVRGPMIGAQHGYVLVRDWLGPPPPRPDRDADLAELALRYLAGHGPASDRDLAKWAGLGVGDARRGLTGISRRLRDRPDGVAELAAGPADEANMPVPKLLGPYDPVLLGWESRADIVGEFREIVTVNGIFRPFALVGGRAAGIWALTGGAADLAGLADLPDGVATALRAEADDIRRFLTVEGE